MSNLEAKHQTKNKMDTFLNSFDQNITIHAGDTAQSHKSIDNVANPKGGEPIVKKPTTTAFSLLTMDDLSPKGKVLFNEYKDKGYCVYEDIFKPELANVQAESRRILDGEALGQNEFYGYNTKRAYSVMAKTRAFDQFLVHPLITEFLEASFAPNPRLSGAQLIEIYPGEKPQKLHFDQQFVNFGNQTRVEDTMTNMLLAIDDFTEDNGATLIIPGSHSWGPDRVPTPSDRVEKLIMKAGSACGFSGLLWHGGGANNSTKPRRAVVLVFVQPWLRTFENNFLSVPFSLAAKLHPNIQSYLGYSIHHPFVGQVDFRHPMVKLLELAKQEEDLKKENEELRAKLRATAAKL